MTTTNAELRALAEVAKVDWNERIPETCRRTPTADVYDDDLEAYIAAASPARILELLSQLDSRDEQIKDQIEHIGKWESRAHRAEDEAKALRAKLDLATRALEYRLSPRCPR